MKKILTVLVLLFISVPVFAFDNFEGFEVSDFSYKIIEKPRSNCKPYCFLTVAFKVFVYNNEVPGTIYVELKGVDRDEYEILMQNFREPFDANERKTLTTTRTFDVKDWEKVREWVIYKANKNKR